MSEKKTDASPFNWWVPSGAGFLAFAASILVAVCQADTALLIYLFFGLLLVVVSIPMLVYTVFGKGRRKRLTLLSTSAEAWVVSDSGSVYRCRVRRGAGVGAACAI